MHYQGPKNSEKPGKTVYLLYFLKVNNWTHSFKFAVWSLKKNILSKLFENVTNIV